MASDVEEDDYTADALQRDVEDLLSIEDDGSGVDATILTGGRSAVSQAAQDRDYERAIAANVVEFAGKSAEAKKLWEHWIGQLLEKRASDPLQFASNADWNEDLDPLIGPRDANRALTTGFERVMGSEDIKWEYLEGEAFRSGERQTWKDDKSAEELLAKIELDFSSGKKLRIRPKRKPKSQAELGALRVPEEVSRRGTVYQGGAFQIERDVFGEPIEDPDNLGYAKMVRNADVFDPNLKYARVRSGKGTRILRDQAGKPILRARAFNTRPVTESIRLQIVSVRLNEQHWEWIYSRHLKNDQMFDTPSMTPYLHNEEFAHAIPDKPEPVRRSGMNETGAAIPLLTRGTLGFSAVVLTRENAEAAKPKVAVASMHDLTHNWYVRELQGLPRMRFFQNKLPTGLVGTTAKPNTFVDVTLQQDQTIVRCYLVGPGNEVQWNTVFSVNNGTELYANTLYSNAEATRIDLGLGVSGYDSWGDGDPALCAGALLASDAPEFADKRLEQSFMGLPLYFASGEKVHPSLTATIGDVRVRDAGMSGGPGDTGFSKSYSEVYRQLMWAPQPVRSVRTFPSSGSAFRTKSDPQANKKDTKEQLPRYLNFTIDTDKQSLTRAASTGANDSESEDSGGEEDTLGGATRRQRPPPTLNKSVLGRLEQHYPEVVLSMPGDLGTRIPQANKFFGNRGSAKDPVKEVQSQAFAATWSPANQQYLDAGRQSYKKFRELKTDMNKNDPTAGRTAHQAWRVALDDKHFAHLAPTTIRGAMGRYMAEQANVLAYDGKDAQGEPRKLNTSYAEGLQQSGGLYYSCRIDTGTGPRQGGLDTFLPVSMDATVFELADLGLARGVHDYVYTQPQEALADGNPEFTGRAGPPQWWHDEQTTMGLRLRSTDRAPYHTVVAGTRVSSIWTDGFVAGQPPPNPEVARARYDYLPSMPSIPEQGARRSMFPTDQLRRLDTAEARPEQTSGTSLHVELGKALTGPHAGALPSHLTPAKLVLGPKLVSDENNVQSVLFGASFRARWDGGGSEAVAKATVRALPHRHDLRVPCMPLYPTRLSLPARRAVWDRVQRLQEADRAGESPEVGKHLEAEAKYYASETNE